METQTEALERLKAGGYEANLWLEEDGRIVGETGSWQASEVTIDEIVRFEGMSDPDDEAMMAAVTCDDETSGVLSFPYGPSVSGDQADAIRELVIAHDPTRGEG